MTNPLLYALSKVASKDDHTFDSGERVFCRTRRMFRRWLCTPRVLRRIRLGSYLKKVVLTLG